LALPLAARPARLSGYLTDVGINDKWMKEIGCRR